MLSQRVNLINEMLRGRLVLAHGLRAVHFIHDGVDLMDHANVTTTMVDHLVHERIKLALHTLGGLAQVLVSDSGAVVTKLQDAPLLGQVASVRSRHLTNISSLTDDVARLGVRAKTLLALGSEQVHATVLNLLGRSLRAGTHNVDHLIVVDLTRVGFVEILRVVVIAELRDL